MDRYDSKYLVGKYDLLALLTNLPAEYSALEINHQHQFSYRTLYFDSSDWRNYHDHHNGKLNRQKIRIRHYSSTNSVFLERKRKQKKGNSIKDRIELLEPNAQQYLSKELIPRLWVNYKRITLLDYKNHERITIDSDIEYISNQDSKNTVKLKDAAIIEIKTNSPSLSSPFQLRLKEQGFRKFSISKYCTGVSLLFGSEVKHNNFKPNLRKILSHINPKNDHLTMTKSHQDNHPYEFNTGLRAT